MIAIDQVSEPRGASRRRDERIELEFIHDEVDALGAAELVIQSQRIEIFFCAERTLLVRFKKKSCPK